MAGDNGNPQVDQSELSDDQFTDNGSEPEEGQQRNPERVFHSERTGRRVYRQLETNERSLGTKLDTLIAVMRDQSAQLQNQSALLQSHSTLLENLIQLQAGQTAPGQTAPGQTVPDPGQIDPAPGQTVTAPSQIVPAPGQTVPAPGQSDPAQTAPLPDDRFPPKMFTFSALPARLLTIDKQPLMTPILKVYES